MPTLFSDNKSNSRLTFTETHTICDPQGKNIYSKTYTTSDTGYYNIERAYLDICANAAKCAHDANGAQIATTKILVTGNINGKKITKNFDNVDALAQFLSKHDLITQNNLSKCCSMM